jgi:hypothetical protein
MFGSQWIAPVLGRGLRHWNRLSRRVVVEVGVRRFPFGSTASAFFLSLRCGTFVNGITEYRRRLLMIDTIGSSGWQNRVELFEVSKVVKRGGGTAKSGRRESLGMRREM